MSYATVDGYRSKVQSGRPDTVEQDAVIQAALDAGHGLIEQRTGRRFDSYTATRTLDVLSRRVLLPDLLTYSSTLWAIRRGYPFAGVEIELDDALPHRIAHIAHTAGACRIVGQWGFDPTPPAIVQCEIDLAAGLLDDGPRATGARSGVGGGDVPTAVSVGPDDTIAAYSDGRAFL